MLLLSDIVPQATFTFTDFALPHSCHWAAATNSVHPKKSPKSTAVEKRLGRISEETGSWDFFSAFFSEVGAQIPRSPPKSWWLFFCGFLVKSRAAKTCSHHRCCQTRPAMFRLAVAALPFLWCRKRALGVSPRVMHVVVVVVVVVVPFRFLAFGSSSLRGDGGSNYVDTVQCTGSGTLPTQPVPGPFLTKLVSL